MTVGVEATAGVGATAGVEATVCLGDRRSRGKESFGHYLIPHDSESTLVRPNGDAEQYLRCRPFRTK